MEIALQEGLLPGDELAEKLDFAEELQIEGLEVAGRSRLYDHIEDYEKALSGRAIRIVSICGQETFDWLDPDVNKRNGSLAATRRQLDTPEAFRQAGKHVAHVHMADNTRMQPGTGDIDWRAGLQALKDIGFSGYLAYECGIDGDRREALRTSVNFVRETIAGLD